ncbi:hypothetical protein H072_11212 [Dactylellina haptotyla CBS 200.50]|uniref:F-box domain-containing protein n=1 Tax=Dactylellina haptotyla (strain CBS 200.50) TaxID=1284197 RepID=S8BJJ5_DACHA|nr:hypothetical protein H072_11212 [Dactylellina haptotyla CBS 200.50]
MSQNDSTQNVATMDAQMHTRLPDLPDEIILNIADYLVMTVETERNGFLNSLAQTCRRLRNILYPLINRHLMFNECNHFPDALLNMVIYSLTEPFNEFVKAATFRLLSEDAFYLVDEYDDELEEKLPVIRSLLKDKADKGEELFGFIEGHIEEYGMATFATIILYQLRNLRELELACSLSAKSSRFLLTTLHYFEPPFHLERLGTTRLVDFDSTNYFILERFLSRGIKTLGIDLRFGSSAGYPKLIPPPTLSEYDGFSDETDSLDFSDSRSDKSVEEDFNDLMDYHAEVLGTDDIYGAIEVAYNGYIPLDPTTVGHDHAIDYTLPWSDPVSSTSSGDWVVEDLRLWMDETPSTTDALISLLKQIKGLKHLDIKFFPFPAAFALHGRQGEDLISLSWIFDIMGRPEVKQTLETLTFRCWPILSRPHIPALSDYTALKRVHMYCYDVLGTFFDDSQLSGVPFIKQHFPPQLEYLRIDVVTNRWAVDMGKEALRVLVSDFPNLTICLGYVEKKMTVGILSKVDNFYMTVQNRSPQERAIYVPVEILNLVNGHKHLSCAEGWRGPFQEPELVEFPKVYEGVTRSQARFESPPILDQE